MNLFTAMLATMTLLAAATTEAQTMLITRGGSRASRPGPAENFTGGVRVEMLFEALDRHTQVADLSRSSPVPAPHGTCIREVRS